MGALVFLRQSPATPLEVLAFLKQPPAHPGEVPVFLVQPPDLTFITLATSQSSQEKLPASRLVHQSPEINSV